MNKALADNRDKALATIDSWAKASDVSAAAVKRITARLLPSIRLVPKKGDTKELGRCRVGGLPDLPAGTSWPRTDPKDTESPPMSFVMQVDLAAVAHLDSDKVLPTEGLLSLFYYWDDDAGDDGGRVLFFPTPVDELERLKAPDDLPKEARYRPFTLEPAPEWTLPGYFAFEEDVPDIDAWFELGPLLDKAQGLKGVSPAHRMLGNPDFIQSSSLEKGDALLLQAGSDDSTRGPGISWGDGGILYCLLRQAYLKKGRLDRARIELEMG